MRRVRVVLALLLLALAVPVGAIVLRALDSIEFERNARQNAVADRVFDEMERTLSAFLAREEARPPEEYAFYSRLEEDGAGGESLRERSPLSYGSNEPYVLLHFQIDPDGSVSTPLEPRDPTRARAFGDWPPPDTLRAQVDRADLLTDQRVKPFWTTAMKARAPAPSRRDRDGTLEDRALDALESPSKTGSLRSSRDEVDVPAPAGAKDRRVEEEKGDFAQGAAEKKKPASAYDVFESLNRAAEDRRSRKQRVAEVDPSQQFARYAQQKALPAPRAEPPLAPPFGAAVTSTEAPAEALAEQRAGRELAKAADASASGKSESESELEGFRLFALGDASTRLAKLKAPQPGRPATPPALDEAVRVILHPMAAAPLGDDLLMLYRTVSVDGVGYRQGLLVDRRALADHLEREVLSALPIADAVQLTFGGGAQSPPAGWTVASHRFVEPFDDLDVRLALAPLAGMPSAAPLYALAALLFVVALVGVVAVHRMVGVVVEFAERRSNFVASVSHELKTPLTSIRMYAEMLRDGLIRDDGKREDYYRTIHDESERLSRLIDNVLEFSRLEKGSRVFNLSVGSVGEIVGEIAERLRPHAEGEGFRLRVEIEPDLPPVRFDRDALVQIVFNLVDNAIKYAADSDRREVVLRCARTTPGGVVVSVRDFGPGVSSQQLAQVFEPFYRAEPELTRAARGSGIGLALVKELGEAMGASVRGANEGGGGFRVDVAFQAGSGAG